jgi:hypothetical protein
MLPNMRSKLAGGDRALLDSGDVIASTQALGR